MATHAALFVLTMGACSTADAPGRKSLVRIDKTERGIRCGGPVRQPGKSARVFVPSQDGDLAGVAHPAVLTPWKRERALAVGWADHSADRLRLGSKKSRRMAGCGTGVPCQRHGVHHATRRNSGGYGGKREQPTISAAQQTPYTSDVALNWRTAR